MESKNLNPQLSEVEIAEQELDEKFDETFEYLECLEYLLERGRKI